MGIACWILLQHAAATTSALGSENVTLPSAERRTELTRQHGTLERRAIGKARYRRVARDNSGSLACKGVGGAVGCSVNCLQPATASCGCNGEGGAVGCSTNCLQPATASSGLDPLGVAAVFCCIESFKVHRGNFLLS